MLPAASGSPGTRISFGKWSHRGWMGAGYLVARRLDPDGMHGPPRRALRTGLSRGHHPARAAGRRSRRRPAVTADAGSGGRRLPRRLLAGWSSSPSTLATARWPSGSGTRWSPARRVPVEPLFGFHHWLALHQIGTIVMMVALVIVFVVAWRRHPRHPILLMVLVTTLLVWQDPIMNWAPYAVYNPQLWHWPETWPLVSLSPTVEPFIVIGYATFYMAPFFPAVVASCAASRPADRWRRSSGAIRSISLSLLILAIGFVFDAMLEMFLVRTQLYIYSQVVPFGSFAAGKWYQFPLIWESALVTLVMIPAGVLLYRDDTGRTQAEKLAQRIRAVPHPPGARDVPRDVRHHQRRLLRATAGATRSCTGHRARLRRSPVRGRSPKRRCTTRTASTRRTVSRARTSPGIWSGWQSGQPNGRPDVVSAGRRRVDAAAAMADRSQCRRHRRVPWPRPGDRRAPPPRRLDGAGRDAHARAGASRAPSGDHRRRRG